RTGSRSYAGSKRWRGSSTGSATHGRGVFVPTSIGSRPSLRTPPSGTPRSRSDSASAGSRPAADLAAAQCLHLALRLAEDFDVARARDAERRMFDDIGGDIARSGDLAGERLALEAGSIDVAGAGNGDFG